ncbi:UNVERIFIED_CONTAM: hypothetical protein Sangu_1697600 [Sesamum angustifolium]|uniref:Reverse transcriptase domain-containing protein n=1 Tax=Sesamum angustifolium TaxID=2727405 RepID=A0AAW2MM15_9LAMI
MDVSVNLDEAGDWWRFTGIYGELDIGKRSEFWNLLCRLHHQLVRPWLCAGDFNEILAHSEKKGDPLRVEWQIHGSWTETAEGVQRCILEYFQGVFTSSKPRPDDIQSGTEFFPNCVNAEMAEDLLRPMETEVTKALFGMSPLKSPGPDGRLITDNVLLAFETNHFLNTHSRGRKHFMNLKLDISKAYDRVEWSFLKRVLVGPNLDQSLPRGDFVRGTLYPYLFLCTESLSSLFGRLLIGAQSRGAVCSEAPRISHLLFADDTMVFSPADLPTVHAIHQILNIYKLASDQEINLHKSFAVFSRNTPLDSQRGLAEALGLCLDNKHEVYLGLPAVAFRSKRAIFTALKDRIWKRIQGWHEKTLSQAGKAVLIQAVVQAIPSYACCFKLPRRYFRSSKPWRLISFARWGRKIIAKQLWGLLSRPESLVCRVLKAKYFPHTHYLTPSSGLGLPLPGEVLWLLCNSFGQGVDGVLGRGIR